MELQTFEFFNQLLEEENFEPTLEKYCRYDLVNSVSMYHMITKNFSDHYQDYPKDALDRLIRVNILIALRCYNGLLRNSDETFSVGISRLMSFITEDIINNRNPQKRITSNLTNIGRPLVPYKTKIKLVELKWVVNLLREWYEFDRNSSLSSRENVIEKVLKPIVLMTNSGTIEKFELSELIEKIEKDDKKNKQFRDKMLRKVTFAEFYDLLGKIQTQQIIKTFYPYIFGRIDSRASEIYSKLEIQGIHAKSSDVNLFLIVKSLDYMGFFPDSIELNFLDWVSCNHDLESVWLNGIGKIINLELGETVYGYLEVPNDETEYEVIRILTDRIHESINYQKKDMKTNLYNLIAVASKILGNPVKLSKQVILDILLTDSITLKKAVIELQGEGKLIFSSSGAYRLSLVFSPDIS